MENLIEETTVIVQVDEVLWRQTTLQYLEESIWHARDNLKFRIDPPRPDMRMLRHVHIAEPKHIHSKRMQVSWNDDGTRHDAGSFKTNFRKMNAAKELARSVMGLGPEITFEGINPMGNLKLIVEALTEGEDADAKTLSEATYLRARLT